MLIIPFILLTCTFDQVAAILFNRRNLMLVTIGALRVLNVFLEEVLWDLFKRFLESTAFSVIEYLI